MRENQFLPLRTDKKPGLVIYFDGAPIHAWHGETVISALLRHQHHLSYSEFDGAARAGFCLMGACQDCTIWSATGARVRACMIEVQPGMAFRRSAPLGDLLPPVKCAAPAAQSRADESPAGAADSAPAPALMGLASFLAA